MRKRLALNVKKPMKAWRVSYQKTHVFDFSEKEKGRKITLGAITRGLLCN